MRPLRGPSLRVGRCPGPPDFGALPQLPFWPEQGHRSGLSQQALGPEVGGTERESEAQSCQGPAQGHTASQCSGRAHSLVP